MMDVRTWIKRVQKREEEMSTFAVERARSMTPGQRLAECLSLSEVCGGLMDSQGNRAKVDALRGLPAESKELWRRLMIAYRQKSPPS